LSHSQEAKAGNARIKWKANQIELVFALWGSALEESMLFSGLLFFF